MERTAKVGIKIREPVTEGVTGVIWNLDRGRERTRESRIPRGRQRQLTNKEPALQSVTMVAMVNLDQEVHQRPPDARRSGRAERRFRHSGGRDRTECAGWLCSGCENNGRESPLLLGGWSLRRRRLIRRDPDFLYSGQSTSPFAIVDTPLGRSRLRCPGQH